MFVGDSFIEGIMAEGHQTIPKVFERQFSEPVETMNAGMLGVDVEKYLQFIADAVPVFKPDVVFLVIYANDFTSGEIAIPNFNLKEEYFTSGKPRLLELIDQYKAGNPVPFVKSFSTKKLLPNITDIAFPYKGRIDEMFLHADSSLVNYMLKAEYNLFKLNEMFRAEKKLREPSNLLVPLDFFRYYAEKYEFEPVVVFLPSRNQVTDHYLQFDYQSSLKFNRNISFTDSIYNVNQARLGEVCSRLGLKYYDFTEELKKQESAANHLYWNYDDHMRAKGYGIVGESIYREWSSQP
jgi:lysophospholipase L1-like esterase